MKRIFALLFALILTVSFSLFASATDFESSFVVDNADLLSEGEEVILADIIGKINFEHDINVVIHTTEDTDGLYIEDYADNFYDNGSYYSDGLVFVISMAERDYYTSTCGYLVDSMPAYDIDSICEPVVPYLSNYTLYSAKRK